MELIKNLRYMCRICAVNIKKRRSSSSAVSIETPQLTEKLKKYLNMDINYNDVLPKSICSMCFKKIEAIHALSALAKKTENFLTDFIKIAQNNLKQAQSESFQTHFHNEFNSFELLDNNDCLDDIICCEDDGQSGNTLNEPEEVVLNFTLNDPLTKNIHKKIVVAKQKKEKLLLNQREKKFQDEYSHFSAIRTSKLQQQQQQQNRSLENIDLNKELQALKRNEQNTSLEQKRQNLKMILNSTSSAAQNSQRSSPESSANNYKLIIPNSSGTNSNINAPGAHSINVAVQIQQQPSTMFSQQSEQLLQSSNLATANLRTSQMMNDCLNLGSVIKDMDLLKLILKALKWPFNQETLNTQIHRLKSTRFRDVMVDPNLLLDTDLMQILSSYLSPILLQTSSQAPSINANLPTNILPPSVSYKIPAETSVRLVCVPREDNQQQEQQQLTLSSTSKKHSRSLDYRYDQPKPKKYSKSSELKYHRQIMMQNYGPPSVIVVSDDESCCSDKVQRFEVNVDPMLYFNGADSSYENSNESTMITMGYFKQHIPKSSEITYQKRKKQKRKQTLVQNPTDKNSRDQDIVIVDENGEKSIHLNNKNICVPAIQLKDSIEIKMSQKDLSMPSTSSGATTGSINFEFTTPKKKRKLNTIKSSKDTNLFSSKLSKDKAMVNTPMPEVLKVPSKISSEKEIKIEKNLDDLSNISLRKSCDKNKNAEEMAEHLKFPELTGRLPDTKIDAVKEKMNLNKNFNVQKDKLVLKTTNLKKTESEKIDQHKLEDLEHKTTQNEMVQESVKNFYKIDKNINDDDDSVDTNDELVIDEGYDDEKNKEEDAKNDSSSLPCEQSDINLVNNDKVSKVHNSNESTSENSDYKIVVNTTDKSPDNSDSTEKRSLRRSRRQTKGKEPIKLGRKNIIITKTLVDNKKKSVVVSTRGQTRQQEQKSKMQTRLSNVSQRGRKQKPFTKYTKKK